MMELRLTTVTLQRARDFFPMALNASLPRLPNGPTPTSRNVSM